MANVPARRCGVTTGKATLHSPHLLLLPGWELSLKTRRRKSSIIASFVRCYHPVPIGYFERRVGEFKTAIH